MPARNIDPYERSAGQFECVECGQRREARTYPGACDGCGGDVKNLAVSQE